MRISKFDQPIDYYEATTSVASDGLVTATYALRYSGIGADIQPMGAKFDPALYGINGTAANARKMFIDPDFTINIGGIVKTSTDTYMVKWLDSWHGHQKAILEPYEAVLP